MKIRAILLTILLLLVPARAMAAAKPQPGLQITPLRAYPVQQPGQTTKGALSLTNKSDKPFDVVMSAQTFGVTDSNYDYSFGDAVAAGWVRFTDDHIALAPNQTKVAAYNLSVPAGSAAGGYYLALVAAVTPPPNAKNVIEIKRVASLVYLEVGGKLIRQSRLVNFSVPWLSLSRSFPVELNLANTGNTHTMARVSLTTDLWPWRRQPQKLQLENLVLPHTVRKVGTNLRVWFLPGIYRVRLQYSPPQGGLTVVSKSIWYLPPWFLVVVAVVVVVVATKLFRRVVKR